jgi:ribosomal protein S27AE
MYDDRWECPHCHKRVDKGRNHYTDGWKNWHIRCWNEIEHHRQKKEKEKQQGIKHLDLEELQMGDRECPNCQVDSLIEQGIDKWICLKCKEVFKEDDLDACED